MKHKLFFTLTLFSAQLLFSHRTFAQSEVKQRIRCSALEHELFLQSQDPNRKAEREAYEAVIDKWVTENNNYKTTATITIPVVVHVVYKAANENISDVQLLSGIKALNEDYARTNADASKTPSAFLPLASSAGIQFCMASIDPTGKPTTGIVRKSTTVQSFSTNDVVKHTSAGGDDAWDVKKYLNIWICDLGSQILGYGEFPKTTLSNTYGLVCHYNTWGLGGATLPPYNLGRTSTHEVGHCFDLWHIWGDEPACNADDKVTDTPMQKSEHYGIPVYPEIAQRCNASDPSSMFMNYMDYSDDKAMNMFTKGQVARIQAIINNPPWNILKSSTACGTNIGLETYTSDLERNISVYPNPADQMATIEFKIMNEEQFVSVSLFNSVGQLIETNTLGKLNEGIHKYDLNVSSINQGLYFISVKIGNTTITRKIAVSK